MTPASSQINYLSKKLHKEGEVGLVGGEEGLVGGEVGFGGRRGAAGM